MSEDYVTHDALLARLQESNNRLAEQYRDETDEEWAATMDLVAARAEQEIADEADAADEAVLGEAESAVVSTIAIPRTMWCLGPLLITVGATMTVYLIDFNPVQTMTAVAVIAVAAVILLVLTGLGTPAGRWGLHGRLSHAGRGAAATTGTDIRLHR
ncbi:hypothetical protein J7I98_11770 [Streptomyces sp. ISL-98]|uniref:hypothetical protein n=1 Tax=Streptomyces sp. ISL-98 TaxID=2819192 RepID=UPI001BE68AC7|nr:hypothetical protein [Streptomyces sp. ISL-98]MBT2506562.1 hypothetical protein [Streptomyces sp. ISL-98]